MALQCFDVAELILSSNAGVIFNVRTGVQCKVVCYYKVRKWFPLLRMYGKDTLQSLVFGVLQVIEALWKNWEKPELIPTTDTDPNSPTAPMIELTEPEPKKGE